MGLPRRFSATLLTMSGPADRAQRSDAEAALAALAESVSTCVKCGLCAGRTQVVFGVGSADAELMFVGEGPGFHEDKQGEPFVGQAGKLLTELLAGIGLARSDVYIANVVKCRPPENRDPTPDEIKACSPHLMDQISVIRPQVICTLGRFATRSLADTELSITAIHGKVKERTFAGVSTLVFPVFHPAAALYTPANRKVLEEDFAKLRLLLGGSPSEPTSLPEPESVPRPESASASERAPAPATGPASRNTEQLPLW